MDFEHPENVTEAEGEDIDEKPEAEQNRTALQPRIPTFNKKMKKCFTKSRFCSNCQDDVTEDIT